MSEQIRFFLPGPVHVPAEVLAAMTRPSIGHRSPEFKALYATVAERLPKIFRTSRDVVVVTSSGSLSWDMALRSSLRKDVLCLTNGAFSERFMTVAKACGLDVDQVAMPWGQAIDPDLLRQALRRKKYEAVTLAHNETSTGVLSPLADLAEVVRQESDAMIFVDAVSSMAGAQVETEAWDIDFMFTGSQKALALPPGLALVSVSERFEKLAGEIPARGYYTDVLRYLDNHRKSSTVTTPAVPQVWALDVQLDRLLAEGLENRWQRHWELRRRTEAWADEAGFEYASAADAASPTVSCLKPPADLEAPALVKQLQSQDIVVGGGYGAWKPSTFRIGHMGEVQLSDLTTLFDALDEAVRSLRG